MSNGSDPPPPPWQTLVAAAVGAAIGAAVTITVLHSGDENNATGQVAPPAEAPVDGVVNGDGQQYG